MRYYNWALLNRDALMPTHAELQRAEGQVHAARERFGERLTIFFVIPDYYEGRPKACMNGWGAIHVTVAPNGNVLPCSQASNFKHITFPNVRQQRPEQIWHDSPVFDLYRGDTGCRALPQLRRGKGLRWLSLSGSVAHGRRCQYRPGVQQVAASSADSSGCRAGAECGPSCRDAHSTTGQPGWKLQLPHDSFAGTIGAGVALTLGCYLLLRYWLVS